MHRLPSLTRGYVQSGVKVKKLNCVTNIFHNIVEQCPLGWSHTMWAFLIAFTSFSGQHFKLCRIYRRIYVFTEVAWGQYYVFTSSTWMIKSGIVDISSKIMRQFTVVSLMASFNPKEYALSILSAFYRKRLDYLTSDRSDISDLNWTKFLSVYLSSHFILG